MMEYHSKLNNLWKKPNADDIEPVKAIKSISQKIPYEGDRKFSKKYDLGFKITKMPFKKIELKAEPLKHYKMDKDKIFLQNHFVLKKYAYKPLKLNDPLVPEPIPLRLDDNPNYYIYGKKDAKDLMIASLQKDANFPNKMNKIIAGDEEFQKSLEEYLKATTERDEKRKADDKERHEERRKKKEEIAKEEMAKDEEEKKKKKVVVKTEPVEVKEEVKEEDEEDDKMIKTILKEAEESETESEVRDSDSFEKLQKKFLRIRRSEIKGLDPAVKDILERFISNDKTVKKTATQKQLATLVEAMNILTRKTPKNMNKPDLENVLIKHFSVNGGLDDPDNLLFDVKRKLFEPKSKK